MNSDVKDTKTLLNEAEDRESVGDRLGYEKDSKERMPWEHYLKEFQEKDPTEIAERLDIPYDESNHQLTLKFLGTVYHITWPDFQVTHEPDDLGFYPLEEMVYARIPETV